MLNEGAYKATYGEVVRLSCPFEKAIMSRCADCGQAQKFNIAEREGVACEAPVSRENCLTLHGLLHKNAVFVFKLTQPGEPLPHAKEIKVQCGGLLGVQRLIESEATAVEDVHDLVVEIHRRYGGMQTLPYHEVVKSVAAYEGRRRR